MNDWDAEGDVQVTLIMRSGSPNLTMDRLSGQATGIKEEELSIKH